MSRKDKKMQDEQKQEQQTEVKVEQASEQVQPKVEEPKANDQDMAKRIGDMEAKIIALDSENKSLKDELSKIIGECNKKLADMDASYQDAYKGQLKLKESQAQEQIKAKLEELQTKAKVELAEAKKYAIEDQALKLIEIITHFSNACNSTPSDPKIANWLIGFKMFAQQFDDLLSDFGITKIVPEIGKEFDPNTMECFEETVKDPSKPDNTVVEVMYPGYKLHVRLLKPAKVKVVKNN